MVEDQIPTTLTRDELLVFNAMCFVHDHMETKSDVAGIMGAFERDDETRNMLMESLLEWAENSHQLTFTTPLSDEQH